MQPPHAGIHRNRPSKSNGSRESTQNAMQLFAADRDDIAAISVAAI
jgi:hypothetical protein